MADLATVIQVLVGSGAGAGLVAIGRFIEKRVQRADDAKDKTIAVLEAENERLRTERNGALDRLQAVSTQLEKERLQAAGVALRIRQDPETDDALVEDMPTAVRNRADLISSKKSLPPGIKEELVLYRQDMQSTPPGAYRPKLPSRRG